MKKVLTIIFIVIGLLLLVFGIFLYMKRDTVKNDNVPKILSREEAVSVITEKVKNVINVYENPKEIFDTEDTDQGLIKLNNYESEISKIFSENGLKEFEKMKFNGQNFIEKKDSGIFVLGKLPEKSIYINSKINVDQVVVKETTITSEVTFSSYSLKENDIIDYYVTTKEILLVKNNDTWLVEKFDYSNDK